MADIVQLKENGVLKYLQTHAKAVEGLDAYTLGKIQGDVVVLYDGLTSVKGIYFDDSQVYPIDASKTLISLTIVWSGYTIGGTPKNYGGRVCTYNGEAIKKMQLAGLSVREIFQYSVAAGDVCTKDIVFSAAGFTGSSNNATTPANGKDNRNIVLRYVAATYAKE